MRLRPSAHAAGVTLLAALLLPGCSREPRIDASSDESLQRSFQEVRNSVPPEQRKEFDTAVVAIACSELNNPLVLFLGPEKTALKIKDRLDGKTAREIMSEAEPILEDLDLEKAAREQVP